MKISTAVMLLKGFGLVGGAMVSTFVGQLAQWANETQGPGTIQWYIIIGTTVGAGMSALVAFLSQSYGNWHAEVRQDKVDAVVAARSVDNAIPQVDVKP